MLILNFSQGRAWTYDRHVFFDLADPRVSVYYFQLIYHFHTAGYNILIKNRIKFIGNFRGNQTHIFRLSNVKIGTVPKHKSKFVYIYDKHSIVAMGNWKKIVLLDPNVFSTQRSTPYLILPFSMSPAVLIESDLTKLSEFRSEQRTHRIIFSGNHDPQKYDDPILQIHFQKLSRIRILQSLSKSLTLDEMDIIEDPKLDLNFLKETRYIRKLIWIKWIWSPSSSVSLDLRIDNSEWLEFLAKSDFFIATPGIRMPLCFNIIEAMSVGTIPILEYPEFFSPTLRDGVNCIAFEAEQGLIGAVRKALNMSTAEIGQLRQGVVAYYDEHLAIGRLTEKIDGLEEEKVTAYFHATQVSLDEQAILN